MNVSHTTTQLAESQPEADSQPPDSAHRTYAAALSGSGHLQNRAGNLSTNKAMTIAFIVSAAELCCPWTTLVTFGDLMGWEKQNQLLPLFG